MSLPRGLRQVDIAGPWDERKIDPSLVSLTAMTMIPRAASVLEVRRRIAGNNRYDS